MRRALSIGADHCGVDHFIIARRQSRRSGPGHIYEERHCRKWKRLNLRLFHAWHPAPACSPSRRRPRRPRHGLSRSLRLWLLHTSAVSWYSESAREIEDGWRAEAAIAEGAGRTHAIHSAYGRSSSVSYKLHLRYAGSLTVVLAFGPTRLTMTV